MKKTGILLLALTMVILLVGCGKSEAVKKAEGLIQAIGEVSLDSGSAIAGAEGAVAALSAEDREALDGAETLQAARDTYDALVIVDLIDDLGEVTLDSEGSIAAIREKYNAASANAQNAVSNYAAFEAAEAEYKRLAEEKAENMRILGQDAVSRMRIEEDKVRNTLFYYPDAVPKYINTRTFALCYVGKSDSSTWMRMRYVYVGNDWVFWDNLIFSIDGEEYSRAFNYFDIERDNSGGKVWEYIDYTATKSDFDLLSAIAASDETIIRFEGDGGKRYDLTVSQKDKDAILDALVAYVYLDGQ